MAGGAEKDEAGRAGEKAAEWQGARRPTRRGETEGVEAVGGRRLEEARQGEEARGEAAMGARRWAKARQGEARRGGKARRRWEGAMGEMGERGERGSHRGGEHELPKRIAPATAARRCLRRAVAAVAAIEARAAVLWRLGAAALWQQRDVVVVGVVCGLSLLIAAAPRRRLLRLVLSLRAHELVEDDREEEVDNEHAAEHRDRQEVHPARVGVRVHDVKHWVGPRVEGDHLQDGDHRAGNRVERNGAAVGVLVEVEAELAVGRADGRVGRAEGARVEVGLRMARD